ncbi:MAG: hypothetical protein M3R04_00705 [bacterium]|nr:hypothetical protein [bacterium]
MERAPTSRGRRVASAAVAAFFAALVAAIVVFAVRSYQTQEELRPKPPRIEQLEPGSEEEAFWKQIYKRRPVFTEVERSCYVDATKFKMRTGDRKQDNAFGGVATDMMKIALSPPDKRPAAPRIDRQNFDLLLGTCPTCGATYMDLDIININTGRPPGAPAKLKQFKLAEMLPELAAEPQANWTFDERSLAHYITQRHAGFPALELGYSALSGAYSGNLSIRLGRKYKLTPAAFYALAAAEFSAALESKDYDNAQAGSLIAMTRGEMYRLLGRRDAASVSFELARELGGLDEKTETILAHLEGLNGKEDFTLQRQPLEGELRPPLGWYIDTLLAGANAELDVQRGKWGALDDPQAIVAQMRVELATQR